MQPPHLLLPNASWLACTPQIVIASVFTAKNCLAALAAQNFHICIVDEAHHTTASTWLEVLSVRAFGQG